MYRLDMQRWKNPILVSSADGVGTKLKIAFATGRHHTVGDDLVNHCVNDIAVQGATPLFFLDYFAVGKLDAVVAAQIVTGLADGLQSERLRAHRRRNRRDARPLSPTANTTWPASSSAPSNRQRCSPAPTSSPATSCSASPPPACTPTATRSPASCSSTWPGTRRQRSFRELGCTCADELLKVHRSYLEAHPDADHSDGARRRRGAHHRRRHHRQSPRILPKGVAAQSSSAPGPCCPSSNSSATSATFRRKR